MEQSEYEAKNRRKKNNTNPIAIRFNQNPKDEYIKRQGTRKAE